MAGYILKMEATRFPGVMNVACKPMKRVKGDSKKFGLRNKKVDCHQVRRTGLQNSLGGKVSFRYVGVWGVDIQVEILN